MVRRRLRDGAFVTTVMTVSVSVGALCDPALARELHALARFAWDALR